MDFYDLTIWQKGHALVLKVYKITSKFPPTEKYGITSQLQRAAVSVCANIVEGFGRESKKEFIQFLSISRGSLQETRYFLKLALDLGLIEEKIYVEMDNEYLILKRSIQSFIKKLKN